MAKTTVLEWGRGCRECLGAYCLGKKLQRFSAADHGALCIQYASSFGSGELCPKWASTLRRLGFPRLKRGEVRKVKVRVGRCQLNLNGKPRC